MYGYLDMIADIYKGVLDEIPEGRNVRFKILYKNPDRVDEIEVTSDKVLYNLLETHGEKEIVLSVENVEFDAEDSIDYTINGFSHELVGRPNVGRSAGRERVYSPPGSVSKRPTSLQREYAPTFRPKPGNIRRGGGIMGRNLGSCTLNSKGNGSASSKSTASASVSNERMATCTSEVSSKGKGTATMTSKFVASAGETSGMPNIQSDNDVSDGDDDSSEKEWTDSEDVDIDNETDSEHDGEGFTDEVPIDDGVDAEINKEDGDVLSDYSDGGECETQEVAWEGIDIASDEKVELKVGQLYPHANVFRAVLREFQIQEAFVVYYMKNETKRIIAICQESGCEWKISAARVDNGGTILVKSFNSTHTCNKRVYKNPNANSVWIAQKLGRLIRADPNLKVDAMYSLLNTKYGLQPNKSQLWRAKKIALEANYGKHELAFKLLPRYGFILEETNPGKFKIQFEQDMSRGPCLNPQFKRLFVCIQASKIGFLKGCRPFIGLDGCHLKGPYGGVLLAAISLDGNNGLFPLAFGVVEIECKDSWGFFLQQLKDALNYDGLPLTLMSDKQKGLTDAISTIFPNAQQRWCARHLYANFKTKHSGLLLKTYFWAAVRAPNEFQFKKAMQALKLTKAEAHDWLMKFPLSLWARHAFDHRCRSDHVTNNMTESFNQWINDLRGKTIMNLIDGLRQQLMCRMLKRFEKGVSFGGKVTPVMQKKLEIVTKDSRFCKTLSAGADLYEVQDGISKIVVNVNLRSCGCGSWQATGLPCKHAASVILHNRGKLEDFCDDYFSVQRFILAYTEMIHPVPDVPDDISDGRDGVPVLDPPYRKKQVGRPKKARKRDNDEGPASYFRKRMCTVTCDNCKQPGHNKRTCTNAPSRGKNAKRKHGQSSQPEVSASQVSTRAQSSSTMNTAGSIQERKRAKMDAQLARKQARQKGALGPAKST